MTLLRATALCRVSAAAAVPTEPLVVAVPVACAAAGLQGVAAAPHVRQAAVQVARTPPSLTESWMTTMATRYESCDQLNSKIKG